VFERKEKLFPTLREAVQKKNYSGYQQAIYTYSRHSVSGAHGCSHSETEASEFVISKFVIGDNSIHSYSLRLPLFNPSSDEMVTKVAFGSIILGARGHQEGQQ
jgi:hypothetical protein